MSFIFTQCRSGNSFEKLNSQTYETSHHSLPFSLFTSPAGGDQYQYTNWDLPYDAFSSANTKWNVSSVGSGECVNVVINTSCV